MHRLVLFDLDGTLLPEGECLPQAQAIVEAVATVFGVKPDLNAIDRSGTTDLEVARSLARQQGVADEVFDLHRALLYTTYTRLFRESFPPTLSPRLGWHEVLGELSPMLLTVVTGNVIDVAIHKLLRTDLLPYFNLGLGAFGSDGESRTELVARSANHMGTSHTIVVGDTPQDIKAAHANSLPAIAFLTPKCSEDALRDAEWIARTPAEVLSAIREWET